MVKILSIPHIGSDNGKITPRKDDKTSMLRAVKEIEEIIEENNRIEESIKKENETSRD
ncbi:MAG: hypothetical protein WC640_02040 [Candidatus Paceibacterota bacterium]|jgi:hypothetical protein